MDVSIQSVAHRKRPISAGFICFWLCALPVGAAEADGLWSAKSLTGDWGGRRTRLAERGLTFEAAWTFDVYSNRSGGAARGSEDLHNFDLTFELDAARRFGWRGTTFFAYVLGNEGGDPSTFVGDAQVIDNIAAPDTWKLYEFWGQFEIAQRMSFLAGLYDLNSEFDMIDSAQLFINSSFGIGPDFSQSGLNGPSIFPTTSLAGRVKFQPSDRGYVQAAVLDGVPGDPDDPEGTRISFGDGVLLVAEAARLLHAPSPEHRECVRSPRRRIGRRGAFNHHGKLAIGGWAYTKKQDDVRQPEGGLRRSHSWGAYAFTEGMIFRESRDPAQGLDLFFRVGIAESAVNRFGTYVGAGLGYVGLIPGRPTDEFGIAVASAWNGDEYETQSALDGRPVESSEIAVEVTYLLDLLPWLSIQPDVQIVIDPDTDPGRDNALALGLRATVEF